MQLASDGTVWVASEWLLNFVWGSLAGVTLAALGRLRLERRAKRMPAWQAYALAVGFGGLMAAGMAANVDEICGAMASAALGARFACRWNFAKHPLLVASMGCVLGLVAMAGGFTRFLLSATLWPNAERIELYLAVFMGAMIFAKSVIAVCKLSGFISTKVQTCPGHAVVSLFALLLCGWLGYGFVTEQAQPLGLSALIAMSALACALGVHSTLSPAYSNDRIDRRTFVTQIEWRAGDEPFWAWRDKAPITAHPAGCRYRIDDPREGNRCGRMHGRTRYRSTHATSRRST